MPMVFVQLDVLVGMCTPLLLQRDLASAQSWHLATATRSFLGTLMCFVQTRPLMTWKYSRQHAPGTTIFEQDQLCARGSWGISPVSRIEDPRKL